MSEPKNLSAKKSRLLKSIEQQREELSDSKQEWLDSTSAIDNGWQTIVKLRKVILLGSGTLVFLALKKPAKTVKISKFVFKSWAAIRLAQRLLTTGQKP